MSTSRRSSRSGGKRGGRDAAGYKKDDNRMQDEEEEATAGAGAGAGAGGAAAAAAGSSGSATDKGYTPATNIGSPLSWDWQANHEKQPAGFVCGDCSALNVVAVQTNQLPVRCRECGYRILYKQRVRRPMEFLAR